MLNIILIGACGRMGQAVKTCAHKNGERYSIIEECDANNAPSEKTADVIIDFSSHEAAPSNIKSAEKLGVPILIGTTGHKTVVTKDAHAIPIMYAPNSNINMHVFLHFFKLFGKSIIGNYEASIIETHHKQKKDAPSGTALLIKDAIGNAQTTSVRAGDVFGKHEVTFYLENEKFVFIHEAFDRSVFANGALEMAQWLSHQPAGLYTPSDFLRSKSPSMFVGC